MKHSRLQPTIYSHQVLRVGLIAILFNLEGLLTPVNAQNLEQPVHRAEVSQNNTVADQPYAGFLSTDSREAETLEEIASEKPSVENATANATDLTGAGLYDHSVISRNASELLSDGEIAVEAGGVLPLDTDVLETPVTQSDIDDTEEIEDDDRETYRKDGPYITLYGIPAQRRAFAEDFIGRATFETGSGVGGALGYRTGDFRFDAELSHFNNSFDDLSFFIPNTTEVAPNQPEQSPGAFVDGRAIMFNIYYDIPLSKRFRPYVGAGVGFYEARISDLSPPGFGGFVANSTSPNLAAYQLRVGLNYSVNSRFDLFTGYRFFQGEQFEYPIENSDLVLRPNGLRSSSLEAGIRIVF